VGTAHSTCNRSQSISRKSEGGAGLVKKNMLEQRANEG
jgi:hypothetical protein